MLLALFAGCDPNAGVCTMLDCTGTVSFQVSGPTDLTELVGSVTANGRSVAVDCPGSSDYDVWCYDQYVSVLNDRTLFGVELSGGDLDWVFSIPASDSGGYRGSGTVTPEWTSTYPNGEGCGACTSAVASVTLEAGE